MKNTDNRIDQYIANSGKFARPILEHLRALVHETIPDIEETIKWKYPHFEKKGTVCSMASFKHHCAFAFPKASLMNDKHGLLQLTENSGMGHFGKIKSPEELPNREILADYIKQAVALNEKGKTIPRPKLNPEEIEIPRDLTAVLDKAPKAKAFFERLSPSYKRDYTEWIAEAKREATRKKRLNTAIEWLSEGKRKNWKYER